MTTNDREELAPEDNPGLEHAHATPEGELMTAEGSTIQDPHGHDYDVTLNDDPGLEHDEATEAGEMMTGSGSTGPDAKDPGEAAPVRGGDESEALESNNEPSGGA